MKILALNPKDFYAGWPVQTDFGRELYRTPGLTFPVLKRLLPPGHEMRYIEGFFDPIPMKRYREAIQAADMTAFTITASAGALSYAVAIQQVKRINPRAFVLAGGQHAATFARRWLDMGVDLIVKGEAESTFPSLIDAIAGKRRFDDIPGVIFKQDGQYIETADAPRLENLDESPIPDWDLIPFHIYPYREGRKKEYIGSIETSRGCVFRCNFCTVPGYWKGVQRYKSVGRVLEEIKQLTDRNVRMISIVDDNFANLPDLTDELTDAMARLPVKFHWRSFLRADTMVERPELIDRLARTGLRLALIGYEATDEQVLARQIGKGSRVRATLHDYREMYQRFRKNGVMIIGTFICGHPDVPPDRDPTYWQARTLCDDPRMSEYLSFPGTKGDDDLRKRHPVKDMFFNDIKLPVFEKRTLSAFLFNLFNILDVPRSLRMLAGPPHYRDYLIQTHRWLWTKLLRINKRKIRDFLMMRRKDLTCNQKQELLFRWYLDDPEYRAWLDRIENRKWF